MVASINSDLRNDNILDEEDTKIAEQTVEEVVISSMQDIMANAEQLKSFDKVDTESKQPMNQLFHLIGSNTSAS